MTTNKFWQLHLLIVVDVFHRFQQARHITDMLSSADQRLNVFREAGAAVAAARIDKVVADTGIGADALTHFLDIRAQALSQV